MEQIRRIMRPTDVPDTGKHAQTQSLHEYLYILYRRLMTKVN